MTTPASGGAPAAPAAPPAPDAAAAPGVRGRICWHDCLAPDAAAAQAFYAAVLGWTLQPWDGPDAYTVFAVDGVPCGGFMTLPAAARAAGAPAHWLTYVGVPDVDAAVAEATAAGATVHVAPRDVAQAGRFAVLADPQGAAYAVYTPPPAMLALPEPAGMAPVGQASWHELMTPDPAAALAYYAARFGWTPAGELDMGEMGLYRMFARGDTPLGGIFDPGAMMQGAPPHWLPYFRVADLGAALERVRAHGGVVANGPMEVPGGDHVAQCLDAQGAAFALHEARAS